MTDLEKKTIGEIITPQSLRGKIIGLIVGGLTASAAWAGIFHYGLRENNIDAAISCSLLASPLTVYAELCYKKLLSDYNREKHKKRLLGDK